MNKDTMRLMDELKSTRIIAGAEMERLCNENKYLEASLFLSIRESLAQNIQLLESYDMMCARQKVRNEYGD